MMEFTGKCSCDNEYNNEYNIKEDCELIEGTISKPIEINKHEKACEIRADLEVERRKSIRIWGQVKDCKGRPVKNALVKLVKEVGDGCKINFKGVAHGITDCLGFYQFEIYGYKDCNARKYRVLVSKQAVGEDIIVKGQECNPCKDSCRYEDC